MKLNCKQGDLAIIVRSRAGNEGKIVQCIRFVGRVQLPDGRFIGPLGNPNQDLWEVDASLAATNWQSSVKYARDSQLRPLRGDLLNDETTTSKEREAV